MNNKDCIIFRNDTFLLNTSHSSYLFRISRHGHLEHLHYGNRVEIEDADSLALNYSVGYGDSILYDEADPHYCLSEVPQEFPGEGRGDYREPAVILVDEKGNNALDLTYRSHEISYDNTEYPTDLPVSRKADGLLTVRLCDFYRQIEVHLFYKVFYEEDVIARSVRIINHSDCDQRVRRIMSSSIDMLENRLVAMSFHGHWAREMGLVEVPVSESAVINGSREGFSSSTCNPGYLLRCPDTTEDNGRVWGFNLIYSGSHYDSTALNHVGQCRTMIGIQPEGLDWILKPEDSFSAPEAVLSFSDKGLNDLSHHFHDFINRHIVPDKWQYKERPILINSWEGFGFSFTQESLVELAQQASELGCELFVLDDGWFRERNNDLSGLGNYETDKVKLPDDLDGLADRIRKTGLAFGLWVEPESVSVESELYRSHPDWAIHDKMHGDLCGRHQLLLDLTRKEVQDFIVENVGRIIDKTKASYIKWDMNRQLLGVDRNLNHRYILALYDVLKRIFEKRPEVLLESCSSGGNRFDLGMACFSPQIWTSDDTDPLERLTIQKNASYLYPLSMMGAHVAASPSAQTLRRTSLPLRFNVATFGDLGYELDLRNLNCEEKQEISRQITFYKANRSLFQFGSFRRYSPDAQRETFAVSNGTTAIAAVYRRHLRAAPGFEKLVVSSLPEGLYEISSAGQHFAGENYGLPVSDLTTPKEYYKATEKGLAEGIVLNNVYTAAGYYPDVRVPLDNGSEMYLINRLEKEE